MVEAESPLVGGSVGAYRVVRSIGAGGMGLVFEAVHERLQKRVALKVLHDRYANRVDAAARLAREARVAAPFRHPHIVSVFDCGEDAGRPFLVMDLIEGPTLARYVEE